MLTKNQREIATQFHELMTRFLDKEHEEPAVFDEASAWRMSLSFHAGTTGTATGTIITLTPPGDGFMVHALWMDGNAGLSVVGVDIVTGDKRIPLMLGASMPSQFFSELRTVSESFHGWVPRGSRIEVLCEHGETSLIDIRGVFIGSTMREQVVEEAAGSAIGHDFTQSVREPIEP